MDALTIGSRGTEVMKIQAVLNKIGFGPVSVDGIYGQGTARAVQRFQKAQGLTADGTVGEQTYKALLPFMYGYDIYTIESNDTLSEIAKKYNTFLSYITAANPNKNPNNLIIGDRIVVPYGIDVVDTNINYSHEILERDLAGLKARYPFLQISIPGKSVLGKNLYAIKIGTGTKQVFYNGAHHSLEWITSPLLMKFLENMSKAYVLNEKIKGYNIQEVLKQTSIYIMPMVNPDGIDLVLNGLLPSNPYYNQLLIWNKGEDFSKTWQANVRGVDLNHNYNASWQLSKQSERLYGIYGPGPTRYSGQYPESEPESKTVADFTRNHNFRLVLAYHSQGQVIYWNYQNLATQEARKIGNLFAKVSGYTLEEPTGITSYAGYKDWFIEKYRRPGYTIEVGLGKNPLPISQFDKIYNDNIELLILAALV